MASSELFTLSTATPGAAWGHVAAAVSGTATATFTSRRGIDLDLSGGVRASLHAAVGPGEVGVLDGSLAASVDVEIGAYTPLDLWSGAGLIARLKVEAALAASLGLSVRLPASTLDRAVTAAVHDELGRLAAIFLDHVSVRAGAWAHVALAAEVVTEAVIVGTFQETPIQPAGFTVAVRYAAGFGFGAGYQVLANCDLANPQQFLSRTADAVTQITAESIRTAVAGRPDAARAAAEDGLVVLKLLIPLGFRAAGQLLAALTEPAPATHITGTQFLRQAQRLVLDMLMEAAAAQIADLLAPSAFTATAASPAALNDLAAAVTTLQASVARLSNIDDTRPLDVFDGILDLVTDLAGFLTGHNQVIMLDESWRSSLCALWAAASLGRKIVAIVDGVADGAVPPDSDILAGTPSRPAPTVVATTVRTDGAQPGLDDLAAFVSRSGVAADLTRAVPGAGRFLTWLATTLHTDPDRLLATLLCDLAAPSTARTHDVTAALGTALADLVTTTVEPVLDDLAKHPPFVGGLGAALLNALVRPAVAVVPGIVLPALPGLSSDESLRRLREGLSAVALQTVTRFLTASLGAVLTAADETAGAAIDSIVADIRNLQQQSRGWQAVALSITSLATAGAILPDDIVDLLLVTKKLVEDLITDVRTLFGVADVALRLGLAGPSLPASLAALSGSSGPVAPQELGTAAQKAVAAAGTTALDVLAAVPDLLLKHVEAQASLLAARLKDAANMVVAAVANAVATIGTVTAQLADEVQALGAKIAAAFAAMAAAVAAFTDRAQALADSALEAVRAEAHRLAHLVVGWLGSAVEGFVDDVVDGVIDALEWLLNHLLGLTSAAAAALGNALQEAADRGDLNEAAVHAAVRDAIRAGSTAAIHTDLTMTVAGVSVHLGSITVPGGVIAGLVHDTVTADPVYRRTVTEQTATAAQIHIDQATLANTQARQADLNKAVLDQETAADGLNAPTVGIRLDLPTSAEITTASQTCDVRVRLTGVDPPANRMFVRSVLGLAPQVTMIVNGAEVPYAEDDWADDGTDLVSTIRLIARRPPAAARVQDLNAPVPVSVEVPTGVAARFSSEHGLDVTPPHDTSGLQAMVTGATATTINSPQRLALRFTRAQALSADTSATNAISNAWPTRNPLTAARLPDGDVAFVGISRRLDEPAPRVPFALPTEGRRPRALVARPAATGPLVVDAAYGANTIVVAVSSSDGHSASDHCVVGLGD